MQNVTIIKCNILKCLPNSKREKGTMQCTSKKKSSLAPSSSKSKPLL